MVVQMVVKICTCPCSCINSLELEGVKLDMTVSESIYLLQSPNKDEVICKLNEEIQHIKTMLLSFERDEAHNDLAKKGRGLTNEFPNNPKNKDSSLDIIIVMDDSLPTARELPANLFEYSNQSNLTIVEIPSSSDISKHATSKTN